VEHGGEERTFRRQQRDFDALFREHYAEIVRYLAARLGSREAAADVAADVFVEAYKRVPLLRWRGKPVLAWLYRVASNMAADQLKRAAREVPVAELPERVAADEDRLPERDAVARALGALPADYQLVVHLRLVEGYPFDDVARVMGRTVGACQMLMLRAGRELRDALQREGIRAGA
jgi:RNA polymerase sigma-70 factor (ECF subfamily)